MPRRAVRMYADPLAGEIRGRVDALVGKTVDHRRQALVDRDQRRAPADRGDGRRRRRRSSNREAARRPRRPPRRWLPRTPRSSSPSDRSCPRRALDEPRRGRRGSRHAYGGPDDRPRRTPAPAGPAGGDAPSAPARATSGRGAGYRTQGAAPADRRGQQVRGPAARRRRRDRWWSASRRRCGFRSRRPGGRTPAPRCASRSRWPGPRRTAGRSAAAVDRAQPGPRPIPHREHDTRHGVYCSHTGIRPHGRCSHTHAGRTVIPQRATERVPPRPDETGSRQRPLDPKR